MCLWSIDPCQSSPCGPVGKCIATNQVQIPYYCQCPDGQNTMFKCADPSKWISEREIEREREKYFLDPCLPNPCGPGECEITANILNGYICRCFDGSIQMTNCSTPKSNSTSSFFFIIIFEKTKQKTSDPCVTLPCGPQGRCLPLTAAPRGYMCMCQVDGVAYTTIDTCPRKYCLTNYANETFLNE